MTMKNNKKKTKKTIELWIRVCAAFYHCQVACKYSLDSFWSSQLPGHIIVFGTYLPFNSLWKYLETMKILHLKAGLAKKTTPNIIIVEIYTYLFILFLTVHIVAKHGKFYTRWKKISFAVKRLSD